MGTGERGRGRGAREGAREREERRRKREGGDGLIASPPWRGENRKSRRYRGRRDVVGCYTNLHSLEVFKR